MMSTNPSWFVNYLESMKDKINFQINNSTYFYYFQKKEDIFFTKRKKYFFFYSSTINERNYLHYHLTITVIERPIL